MAVLPPYWTLVLLISLLPLVQAWTTSSFSSPDYDYGQDATTDSEPQTTGQEFETGTSSWPEDTTSLAPEDSTPDPQDDTTPDPQDDTTPDNLEDTTPDNLEDTSPDNLEDTTPDPPESTTVNSDFFWNETSPWSENSSPSNLQENSTGWSIDYNSTFQSQTTANSSWIDSSANPDVTTLYLSDNTTFSTQPASNSTVGTTNAGWSVDYNSTFQSQTTANSSWIDSSANPDVTTSYLSDNTTFSTQPASNSTVGTTNAGWSVDYNSTFQSQTTANSSWIDSSANPDVTTSYLSDNTTFSTQPAGNSTVGTTEWNYVYNTSSQPGTTEVQYWNETSPRPEDTTPAYPGNESTTGITLGSETTVRNDTPGWTPDQLSTVETLTNTTEIQNYNSSYLSSTQIVSTTSLRTPTENGTSSPAETTNVDNSNETVAQNSTLPTTAVDTASSSTESSSGVLTTVAATPSPTTAVRTTTNTPTTTKPSETARQQRELYPWGSTARDSQIKKTNSVDYWYWYDLTSQPIYFTGGVPVGSRKFQVAYVKSNGVVLFGTSDGGWWPNGEYSYSQGQTLLAPYWFDTNYEQSGTVFYHLYQQADKQDSSPYRKQILDRATLEVQEFTRDQNFVALSALVVTWWQVEPYRWYYWVCDYYRLYGSYYWWSYYTYYYNQYCLHQYKETNTFQTVYVTNGQEAYTITTYKYGEMQWEYEMYRNIFVGYVTTDDVRDYGVTYTEQATKLDRMLGNTGRYGTWIEQVGKIINPDGRCLQFYLANLPVIENPQHQKFVQDLFDCPCSLDRLGAQWWSYSWDYLPETPNYYSYRVCYAISSTAKTRLVRLQNNPLNKLCCYILNYPKNWWNYWIDWWDIYRASTYIQYRDPQAGHLLLNDPWYWQGDPRKSREEDFNPHRWCCQDASSPSKSCALFNVVRPDYGCSQDAEFVTGVALGDPQFVTPDGLDYTFNGLGEFILLITDSFIFQCRTGLASNAQGQPTSATVFIAFAVKDGENATFQVELDTLKTGMVITACGSDITNAFYQTEKYSQMLGNSDVGVKREDRNNKTTVIASFPSGFSVEVNVGKRNLEFSVNVPRDYQGKTSGLLGNCNGDPSDDLRTPEGKVLTPQETDTERKIYDACMQWMVTTSNSVFQYLEGQSALTFQNSTFRPTFIEDYNSADLEKAQSICGEKNTPCISDYLATQDEELAFNTLNVSRETTNIKISQANNPPKLEKPLTQLNNQEQWEVTHGNTAVINFHATDTDVNDVVSYVLTGNATNAASISQSGVLTYTPNASEPVVLKVQAKDSQGAFSSAIYLDIVVCSGCSGHGSCNPNLTREPEFLYGRFLIRTCNCWPAYTGEDCQEDLDGCAAQPCSPNQTCTDLSPSEQGNNLTGYTCGPCPNGFIKSGSGACIDQNECITNGTKPICGPHANCTNTYGSYECNCLAGYREDPNNNTLCEDINECQEKTDHCDQICINQDGNYSCACYNGSTLNGDGRTCKQDDSLTGCPKCEHFCIAQNNSFSCGCKAGYTLSEETNCIDIDECSLASRPCSQGCSNRQGGFTCLCYPGYKLSQDGVSCTACSSPYYGENCSSVCVCNGRGACNSVQGCQCNSGWLGQNCDQDENECVTNSSACPAGQLCSNTKGSFKCSCPVGYILSGNECQDVDECLDILANNCTLSVEECVNNPGSYGCKCRTGFARNSIGTCKDIDECLAKSHNCEQQCQNTPGSYNCQCYYGYHLDTDRSHCIKDEVDVCAGTSQICNGVCTVDLATNKPVCKCNSGYSLVKDVCQDVDECKFDHLNLCSYKSGCNNTEGGYTCSCPQGSVLDNDNRTCQDCVSGKWGIGCSKDCKCAPGASGCDKVQGCVCQHGFKGEHCEEDIDECATGILICNRAGESCINTPGNAFCQCAVGYERIGDSCQDIDECASVTTNKCDQVCQNTPGSYSCSCNVGYTFSSGTQSCHDINECDLKLDGCDQICVNTEGGFRCSCPAGMKLDTDGASCSVVDTCTNKMCDGRCALVQQTETCFCPRGKVVNGSHCDDVDMCDGNTCSDKTSCQETADGTGFICSCPSGQKLAADGYTCVDCTEGTYGDNCAQKCSCAPTSTESCNKINGACKCKDGWKGGSCSDDVNECEDSTICQVNSNCTNTLGSYVCQCRAGYFTNQKACEACPPSRFGVECQQQCRCNLQHSECDAISGECRCSSGWEGLTCDTDVDECHGIDNDCTAANENHWVCFNSPGSYKCDCENGYEKSSSSSCVDMDECAADFSNQCEQSCTNTEGNYTCSCQVGYTLAADGHSCQDIDECQQNARLCQQNCVNDKGSFHCSCQDGYQLSDTDNSTCYASLGVSIKLIVPKDVSGKNLREQKGKDYINLKNIIEPELKKQLLKTVASLIRVLITQLSQGSLVINFDVTLDKSMDTNAASKMVEAIMLLFNNGVVIDGAYYSDVTLIVGNITVNSTTDKCLILEYIQACNEDETCAKNSNGMVYCSKKATTDLGLVMGLSIGLPVGAALIVLLVGFLCYYKQKYNKLKRIHVREANYEKDNRTPSPGNSSYFVIGSSSEKTSNKLPEDKQNLYY